MDLTSQSQKELDNSSEIKNLKKIEAALFISARYMEVKGLVELTDINPLLLKELLEKLRALYSKRESAIEIIEKNGLWKMDIREEHSRMINKFATGNAEFTKAEQETLAVIAYKQPVKQSVIIKIRGNKAYEHIKHFVDIGLVKSKKSGRTKELSLSEEFYDYFHIKEKDMGDKKKVEEKLEERTGENNGAPVEQVPLKEVPSSTENSTSEDEKKEDSPLEEGKEDGDGINGD